MTSFKKLTKIAIKRKKLELFAVFIIFGVIFGVNLYFFIWKTAIISWRAFLDKLLVPR